VSAQALAISNLARIYMNKQQWDSAYAYLEELLALRANAPEAERFRTYASVMNFYEKKASFTSDPTLKQKMYLKALEWHKKN